MNSGSFRYRAYCSRNSSSAWISVSATNTPPYAPKWPRSSGRLYEKSPICTAHLADESDDFRGALDPLARLAIGFADFDAAGDVDRPGMQLPHCRRDVLRREPPERISRRDIGSVSCGGNCVQSKLVPVPPGKPPATNAS